MKPSRSPTASDLNGYNKKNKLGLKGLSPEEVISWLTKLQVPYWFRGYFQSSFA